MVSWCYGIARGFQSLTPGSIPCHCKTFFLFLILRFIFLVSNVYIFSTNYGTMVWWCYGFDHGVAWPPGLNPCHLRTFCPNFLPFYIYHLSILLYVRYVCFRSPLLEQLLANCFYYMSYTVFSMYLSLFRFL